MRKEGIWPEGPRVVLTDAFGVGLLVSMHAATRDRSFLEDAVRIADAVDDALIARAPYHHRVLFVYALSRLGRRNERFRDRAVQLAREAHQSLSVRGDDASPLDPFYGYVVYRLLDERALAGEIADLGATVERSYESLVVRQDLGLGMMLWLTHFFPDEPWARVQEARSLDMLDRLWVDPPGYFCRLPGYQAIKYAFSNYAIALGLSAVSERTERRWLLHDFFAYYRSGDEYDRDGVTHVLRCVAAFPGEFLARGCLRTVGD